MAQQPPRRYCHITADYRAPHRARGWVAAAATAAAADRSLADWSVPQQPIPLKAPGTNAGHKECMFPAHGHSSHTPRQACQTRCQFPTQARSSSRGGFGALEVLQGWTGLRELHARTTQSITREPHLPRVTTGTCGCPSFLSKKQEVQDDTNRGAVSGCYACPARLASRCHRRSQSTHNGSICSTTASVHLGGVLTRRPFPDGSILPPSSHRALSACACGLQAAPHLSGLGNGTSSVGRRLQATKVFQSIAC